MLAKRGTLQPMGMKERARLGAFKRMVAAGVDPLSANGLAHACYPDAGPSEGADPSWPPLKSHPDRVRSEVKALTEMVSQFNTSRALQLAYGMDAASFLDHTFGEGTASTLGYTPSKQRAAVPPITEHLQFDPTDPDDRGWRSAAESLIFESLTYASAQEIWPDGSVASFREAATFVREVLDEATAIEEYQQRNA